MGNLPADWAIERACEMANANEPCGVAYAAACAKDNRGYAAIRAFARYIEQHEKPPVDPDLQTAKEVVALFYEENPGRRWLTLTPDAIRAGNADPFDEVLQALRAIKLAREKGAL